MYHTGCSTQTWRHLEQTHNYIHQRPNALSDCLILQNGWELRHLNKKCVPHFTPTQQSNNFISFSRLCNLLELNLAGHSFQGNRELPWNDSSLKLFSLSVWSSSGVKSQEVKHCKRVWNREHILHSNSLYRMTFTGLTLSAAFKNCK